MRIYSNKHLTVAKRLELWRIFHFPTVSQSRNDIVFKIDHVSNSGVSFFRTNRYTSPPIGFITEFVWEYPDKQIGVCSLDLKKYDMYRFDKVYQTAIQLPDGVVEGDLVYVDTKKLMRYELV